MSSHSRSDLLRYKIAPKYPLSGPFHHSGVGRNPEVAGRFVAIISFLHTLVSLPCRSVPCEASGRGCCIAPAPGSAGGICGRNSAQGCPRRILPHTSHRLSPRWSRMLTRSSTKVSREGSYWSSSMMDSPIPLMSGRRMRNSRDSNGAQLCQNLPLRENPCCNSIVGADRHGSVKSSS